MKAAEDYRDMITDPRPGMPDSHLWPRLLLGCVLFVSDRERAERLLTTLWTFRAAGAIMQRKRGGGFDLLPDLDWPGCEFDDFDFEGMKIKHLQPYAAELRDILGKVDYEWHTTQGKVFPSKSLLTTAILNTVTSAAP